MKKSVIDLNQKIRNFCYRIYLPISVILVALGFYLLNQDSAWAPSVFLIIFIYVLGCMPLYIFIIKKEIDLKEKM